MNNELLQIDTLTHTLHLEDYGRGNRFWDRNYQYDSRGPGYQLELWEDHTPGQYRIGLFRTNSYHPDVSGNVTSDWGAWSMQFTVDIEGRIKRCDRIVARCLPPRDLMRQPFDYYRAQYRFNPDTEMAVLNSVTKMTGAYEPVEGISMPTGTIERFGEGELPVARRAFSEMFKVEDLLLGYIYNKWLTVAEIDSHPLGIQPR